MQRMNPFPRADAHLLARIVRATAIFGLLTATGCGPGGEGSVDRASVPDLSKISASSKSEPSPGARKQPARPASKKPAQVIAG
jgi:hypothetical protein